MSKSQTDMEELIHHVLTTQFGREVTEIYFESGSHNSKVYTLFIGGADPEIESTEQKPCLPGAELIPSSATKLVMRFTDPDANLNDAVVVQSEVASMTLARDALASLGTPLVPRVYSWKAATADEAGWILMEFLPGTPISIGAFEKMDNDAKRGILKQISQIFKLIQQYELPASVKGYGGLGFGDDGSIVVGPTPIYGATGACDTYHQLYHQYLLTQLAFMDKCDTVRGWKGTDLRKRIDEFVTKGFMPLLERATETKPRQTLIHGDFDLHNLLFDPESQRITALLDFSFSHIASPADEYFYSFDRIQGLAIPPGANDLLRQSLFEGFDATAKERKSLDGASLETAVLRDEEFALAGVQRPVDLMPGIQPLSELYWFIQNISPALFFVPRVRAKMTPEKAEAIRSHTEDDLQRTYLGPWGY